MLSACSPAQIPDFTLGLTPVNLSLTQGASADLSVNLERLGGFTSPVQISVNGLPSGVTATPATLTLSSNTSSAVLTLTASGTAVVGLSSLTFSVSGGGITKNTALALTTKKPDPDFSFTVSASSSSVVQGAGAMLTMKVTKLAGFSDAVQFDLKDPPSGLTATPVTAGCAGGSACLSLSAAPGRAPGLSTLSVRGSAGTVQHLMTLDLTVTKSTAVTVSSLMATPQTGVAPLQSSFVWVASGRSGHALTCGLDVNGDGKSDYALGSCTSGTQAHTYTAPGTFRATLTVTDDQGYSDTKTLLLNPVDPNTTDLFFTRIEWGQSILKPDLRLVAGKSAILRAFVTASHPGLGGVTVRATGWVNGAVIGSLDLTAPATVPTLDSESDLNGNYWGVLPVAWIKPGLEVKLEIDPAHAVAEVNEDNNAFSVTPEVGAGNKLFLTMVPVVMKGVTPAAPDLAALKAGLMAYWPFADVNISLHAPYTATGTTSSQVLSEVTSLRSSEGSKRYYYGFYGAGGGIGWVGLPAAAGDPSLRVMAHELGHNFGQWHAPCGNPSDVDLNFPYADGGIGSWGFDPRNNTVLNPTKYKDVMGYCNTLWVSDYMYHRVQTFLEQSPPQALVTAPPTDQLLVSGNIVNGQITLEPLQRITAQPATPQPGLYRLHLEGSSGISDVDFDAAIVTHEDGSGRAINDRHFSFTLPDPGEIERLEIRGFGVTPLFRVVKPGLKPQSIGAKLSLQRSPGRVTLRWDAVAFPSLSLAHIATNGERTTLALNRTGGNASLETGDLPAGEFEVSLSDGINGFKQRF